MASKAVYEKAGIRFTQGSPLPFGACCCAAKSINFSINSLHAASCTLVLYHKGAKEPFAELELPQSFKTGANFAIRVLDLEPGDLEYGYRFEGPYDESKGLLFDKSRVLLDPYAKLISGHEVWGELAYKDTDYPLRSCLDTKEYDWEGDRPLNLPLEKAIIYETHVRSFTKDESSGVAAPGTYAGLMEKLPYLKELGVNCIELLPVFDFNEREFDNQPEKNIVNLWGYSPLSFFAPKLSYAHSGQASELKDLVKALHKAGIEVILDVVYNHTAEFAAENIDKPLIYSLRGIDNPTYYLLKEDGKDYNFSGCFNTLNCAHPVVSQLILDSLRHWVTEYHVDGFRFDLASILARGRDGELLDKPQLLEAISLDPILANTKLIAEAWDAGGAYQVGNFPAPGVWSQWNDRFRNTLRGYLRGEALAGKDLVKRIQGSPDIFAKASASINMVTCHDGFTLTDVFSYNEKHNLANGDQNKDGSDWNVSWNCGCEGPTEDVKIQALRKQCVKNALSILLISRGVPLLLAGDEFGNSQQGNNNAYCQDNKVSWLNWTDMERHKDVLSLVKKMIALRKAHPVLSCQSLSKEKTSLGYPYLSFHGTLVDDIKLEEPMLTFAALYAEPADDFALDKDSFIYVGMNQYEQTQKMQLPRLPEGFSWRKYLDTADSNHEDEPIVKDYYNLVPRAVVVLVGEKQG